MTDQQATEKVEWIFAGQRVGKGNAIANVWVDEKGEELWFKKLPAGMPGQVYAVEVQRNADGRTTVVGSPRYLAEQATRQPTQKQIDGWRAEHFAAKQMVESIRTEKQAATSDELEQALNVIRRHRERLRSYAKKAAFDTYVHGEIQRPAREDD